MNREKLNFAAGIKTIILLTGIATLSARADDQLQPAEILKTSQARYNSLTNYSDEGQSVSTLGGQSVAPCNYTIKLARPNHYRIAWDQNTGFFDQKGVVWSAGTGDFLKTGDSVQKEPNLSGAMSSAAGVSGGATATIPSAFFKISWGNPLGVSMAGEKRLPDATAGTVGCFVLTRDVQGTTTTLWIGKEDFLIHQIQRVTSAEVVKARLAAAARQNPQLAASLPATPPQAISSTETHTHILVNQMFSPADFDN